MPGVQCLLLLTDKRFVVDGGGDRVFHQPSSGNRAHVPNAGFRVWVPRIKYFHGFSGGKSIRALLDTASHAARMMVCIGIRSNADQRRRARALEPGASCRVRRRSSTAVAGRRVLGPLEQVEKGGGQYMYHSKVISEVVTS